MAFWQIFKFNSPYIWWLALDQSTLSTAAEAIICFSLSEDSESIMLAFTGNLFYAIHLPRLLRCLDLNKIWSGCSVWPLPILTRFGLPFRLSSIYLEHFIARFYDVKPSFLELIAMSLLGLRFEFGLRLTPILICSDLSHILGRSVNWHLWLMLWDDSQQIHQYPLRFNVDLFDLLPCWYVPPQQRIRFPLARCLEFWASVTILVPPQQRIFPLACCLEFLASVTRCRQC